MFRSAASSFLAAAAKPRGAVVIMMPRQRATTHGTHCCLPSPCVAAAIRGVSAAASSSGRLLDSSVPRAVSLRPPFLIAASTTFSTASTTTPATTTTTPTAPPGPSPLDAFRDGVPRQQRMNEPVGRPWSVKELRRKSYDDMHKLWYVLYKERNMLLTELQLSRRRGLIFPQPERMKKVQKSMGAIRQVLGERKREKIAAFRQQQQQESDEPAMDFHE